jgi:hypothetical protein
MAKPGTAGADAPFKYKAFISYSRKDRAFALKLQRELEGYVLARANDFGGAREPRRPLYPVFRDESELVPGQDLPERIRKGLEQSEYLIVVCSPNAAASEWVEKEIVDFTKLSKGRRILAVVIDGIPAAERRGATAAVEALPRALRFRVSPSGEITDEPAQPDWVDRRKGVRDHHFMFLRLVGALLGLESLDELILRDRQRRRSVFAKRVLIGFGIFLFGAIVLGTVAESDRRARLASHRGAAFAFAALPPPHALLQFEPTGLRKKLEPTFLHFSVFDLAASRGRIVAHKFFDDDKFLLMGLASGEIQLAELDSLRTRHYAGPACADDKATPWPDCAAFSVAISPDGRLLASGSGRGVVTVFDRWKGNVVARRAIHRGIVTTLEFVNGGKEILSGGYDHTVLISDAGRLDSIRQWDFGAWVLFGREAGPTAGVVVAIEGGALFQIPTQGEPLPWPETFTLSAFERKPRGIDQMVEVGGKLLGVESSWGTTLTLRDVPSWKVRRIVKLQPLPDEMTKYFGNKPFLSLAKDLSASFARGSGNYSAWSKGPDFSHWILIDEANLAGDGISPTGRYLGLFTDMDLYLRLRNFIDSGANLRSKFCGVWQGEKTDPAKWITAVEGKQYFYAAAPQNELDRDLCRRQGLLSPRGWIQLPLNIYEYIAVREGTPE